MTRESVVGFVLTVLVCLGVGYMGGYFRGYDMAIDDTLQTICEDDGHAWASDEIGCVEELRTIELVTPLS